MKFNQAPFFLEMTDGTKINLYLEESLPLFESQEEYDCNGWDELPDIDFEDGYWSILARTIGEYYVLVVSITTYGQQLEHWYKDDQYVEYAMPLKVDVLWQLDAYEKVKEFAVWYNDNVAPFDPQIVEDALIAWCSR